MKIPSFLLFFFITIAGSGFADQSPYQYCHLWEEAPHFIYYRVLALEGSVYDIGDLLKKMDVNDQQSIDFTIKECLLHLDTIEKILGNKPLLTE